VDSVQRARDMKLYGEELQTLEGMFPRFRDLMDIDIYDVRLNIAINDYVIPDGNGINLRIVCTIPHHEVVQHQVKASLSTVVNDVAPLLPECFRKHFSYFSMKNIHKVLNPNGSVTFSGIAFAIPADRFSEFLKDARRELDELDEKQFDKSVVEFLSE